MDNNNSEFVQYDDINPFDSPLLRNIIDNVDPTLLYVSLEPEQQNDPLEGIQQGNVPFPDPTIQDQSMRGNNNFPIGGGIGKFVFEAGSSSTRGRESTIQDHTMHYNNNFSNGGGGGVGNFEPGPSNQNQPANENNEEVYWPPIPKPFFCTSCQVLRQIIHTNGSTFEKLEIHGTIGVISHVIIQNQEITPSGPSSDAYQMIDFSYKSTEQIKNYLHKYCAHHIAFGNIIVEDRLSVYYEVLCSGLDSADVFSGADDSLISSNDVEPEPEPEPEPEKNSRRRPHQGAQRKRIKNMTLNDLRDVFHITIEDAAIQLRMSVTAVKTVCRRGKLERWPQRKVSSLVSKVQVLKRALDSPDPGTRVRTKVAIQRLEHEIIESCGGITPTGIQLLQLP